MLQNAIRDPTVGVFNAVATSLMLSVGTNQTDKEEGVLDVASALKHADTCAH